MGGNNSKLDKDLVDEYVELTYFTRKEISILFKKFCSLDKSITHENIGTIQVDESQLKELSEFQQNPFLHRLIDIFSNNNHGEERSLGFEDFLDLMNVLSIKAPFSLKAYYAFRIFDFDGDDFVGGDDLRHIINSIAKNDNEKLKKEEIIHIIKSIMEEADLDKDNKLGESEFEHMLKKSPDFMESFQVGIV